MFFVLRIIEINDFFISFTFIIILFLILITKGMLDWKLRASCERRDGDFAGFSWQKFSCEA